MDRRSKYVYSNSTVVCEIFLLQTFLLGSSSDGEFGFDSRVIRISLTFW